MNGHEIRSEQITSALRPAGSWFMGASKIEYGLSITNG